MHGERSQREAVPFVRPLWRPDVIGGASRFGNILGNNYAYNCLLLPTTANQNPMKPLLVKVLWMVDT